MCIKRGRCVRIEREREEAKKDEVIVYIDVLIG
jgi:hypothetical protein